MNVWHKIRPIVTQYTCIVVCVWFCWPPAWVLQNRTNQLKFTLGSWLMGTHGIMHKVGPGSCHGKGHFCGVTLRYVQICPPSVFSVFFAMRQQRYSLWLPVLQQFIVRCYHFAVDSDTVVKLVLVVATITNDHQYKWMLVIKYWYMF